MAQVFFDPAVGGDGSTVSDDSNGATGLANGGHRLRFVPALAQIVNIAKWMLGKVTEAASSSNTASASASIAAGYAAAAGSATSGSDPAQMPLHHLLGTAAYLNKTWLYGSATYDPPSVAAGASVTAAVAVPGAELGDFVNAAASIDVPLIIRGRVSAVDTVTLTYFNPTGSALDVALHTVYVEVTKRLA